MTYLFVNVTLSKDLVYGKKYSKKVVQIWFGQIIVYELIYKQPHRSLGISLNTIILLNFKLKVSTVKFVQKPSSSFLKPLLLRFLEQELKINSFASSLGLEVEQNPSTLKYHCFQIA